jgi:hypothetical protein
VFENRVLRRIFGPKRDEVTGEWRKLHSEELHNLYSSPNIIWHIKSGRMRWAGHAARMGEEREVYRVLVRKAEGKTPLGRPRCIWEDGIRMDLREIGWGLDWIRLAQARYRWRAVVNVVMKLRVFAPRSYLVAACIGATDHSIVGLRSSKALDTLIIVALLQIDILFTLYAMCNRSPNISVIHCLSCKYGFAFVRIIRYQYLIG